MAKNKPAIVFVNSLLKTLSIDTMIDIEQRDKKYGKRFNRPAGINSFCIHGLCLYCSKSNCLYNASVPPKKAFINGSKIMYGMKSSGATTGIIVAKTININPV